MNGYEKALGLLPRHFSEDIAGRQFDNVEEIRLRTGKKPNVLMSGTEFEAADTVITSNDIDKIVQKATAASYHMSEAAMSEGYINYQGIRIGLCGSVSEKNGRYSFNSISSLSIRIPRECKGVCDDLINGVYKNRFESSLVISAPGGGKTTALRELCRVLSNRGLRVSVVDERNELASIDAEGNSFDLGLHSDVLIGANKFDGSIMLLRAMNPQIIVMDEITKECDIDAISHIAGCGVSVLASAHASKREELYQRREYRKLIELEVFKYLVTISGQGIKRNYKVERLDR